MYNFQRNTTEYSVYSANVTDYFFTSGISTLLNQSHVMQKWNSFDKHFGGEKAGFPGFLVSILGLFGLLGIYYSKKEKWLKISVDLKKNEIFFLSLIVIGFIFSLGGTIILNGNNTFIPNLYIFLAKRLPFLDVVRSTARWSFLLYFGLIWFSMKGFDKIIEKIKNKNLRLSFVVLIFSFFVIEFVPIKMDSHAEEYYVGYSKIEEACRDKKQVLLELPVSHLDYSGGLLAGLNYISKTQMASAFHKCYLKNGYSGYEPENLSSFRTKIDSILSNNDTNEFIHLMKQENINLLKINDARWNPMVKELVSEEKLKELDQNIFLIN